MSNTAPGGNEADTDKKMGGRDGEEEVEKIRGMAPDVPGEAARKTESSARNHLLCPSSCGCGRRRCDY